MKVSRFKNKAPIFAHLLGWGLVGTVLFILSPASAGIERPDEFWIKQAFSFFLLLGAFYFNYFYLVPRFIFTNRIQFFLLINLVLGLIYVLILIVYDDYANMAELMHKAYRPDKPYVPRPRNYYWDISHFISYSFYVGISTSIAVIRKWNTDEKKRLEFEQERASAELSYLKAQINPHFFFNTLNNIYALTNLDIAQAQSALMKLSGMMRYALYETEKNYTLLSREMSFLKDYIELMKMRLSSRVKLQIQIPDQVKEEEVAPMLLLPFVENCFKHGVSSQHESEIVIQVEYQEGQLHLRTLNSIFKSSEHTPEGKEKGIGITNTLRRLELMYPDKFKLEIDPDYPGHLYSVHLSVQLI